jgi:hypothetical protein
MAKRPKRKKNKALENLAEPPSVILRTTDLSLAAHFMGRPDLLSTPLPPPPADSFFPELPPWELLADESIVFTGPDDVFAFPVRHRAEAADLQVKYGPFALYAICRTESSIEDLKALQPESAPIELEVLYVGRATGKAKPRSALDRIDAGHTKYQQILEDHLGDTRLLMLTVGSGLTCNVITAAEDPKEVPIVRDMLTRELRIALNEALVINHFQPAYNDQLVDADLTATAVFAELRAAGVKLVALPLSFDVAPVKLWSPAVPAATIHWIAALTGLEVGKRRRDAIAWASGPPWPKGVEVVRQMPEPGFVAVTWTLDDGRKALGVMLDPTFPHLTPGERLAIHRRNAAQISGRCACGAVATTPPGGVQSGERAEPIYLHERDCPAADDSPAIRSALGKMARSSGA